jgi:hypothetical protein
MQQQQRPPLDEILDSSTDELEANDGRELTPKIEQSLADFGIKATVRISTAAHVLPSLA